MTGKMPQWRHRAALSTALALAGALLLGGCELRQAMYDQPKYESFEVSDMFEDGRSARQPVEGTVARGQLRLDAHLYEGKVNGELATTLPLELTEEVLVRGGQRYDIFCSPCHDRTGTGNGMIVKRGLKQPPSFHIDRLREVPIGHFFDLITNGFGAMYGYADRVPVKDRWAIAAYVRALQFSQGARFDELPPEDQRRLQ